MRIPEGRSIHNGRRDHCICDHCWGECFRTVYGITYTCSACYGTGKAICYHRDTEQSNRERSTT